MRVNLLSFLKREPEAKYVVHCKGIEWKSEPQSLSEAERTKSCREFIQIFLLSLNPRFRYQHLMGAFNNVDIIILLEEK